MNLEQRIAALEAKHGAWPEISVKIVVVDRRKDPWKNPEPDRLSMIIRAGTPTGGQTFHRLPDETEEQFIKRAEA